MKTIGKLTQDQGQPEVQQDLVRQDQVQQLVETARKQEISVTGSKKRKIAYLKKMTDVWESLGAAYGAKFLNQFGDIDGDGFRSWCNFLQELTPEQLDQGLVNLFRDKPQFAPDANEFYKYCTDLSSFGLPDERKAYLEAMKHAHEWQTYQFSHPAVLAALKASNITDMRRLPEAKSSKIFYRNYKIICRQVMHGLPIDATVPKALPETVERACTPEENKRNLKLLLASVKL